MPEKACRIDVWLWRARICKTRALAAEMAEAGRVRRLRGESHVRLDTSSRTVRVGDGLIFVAAGRLTAIRVTGLGRRRGPPAEARALYAPLEDGLADPSEPPPLTSALGGSKTTRAPRPARGKRSPAPPLPSIR